MKNFSIFAATSPKSFFNTRNDSSYFYGYTDAAYHKDIRLSIHNGLLHSCCNLTLARCGAIAFLICITLIFHYMPKSMNNYSSTNNSNANVTSAHETREQLYSKFLIEKNAKNKAYFFILSHGLLKQFSEFSKNYQSNYPHKDCFNYLLSNI